MSEVIGVSNENILVENVVNTPPKPKMVAPILRVEELREEEGVSTCDSPDSGNEGGMSHGEVSDVEVGEADKKLGEFIPPDEDLTDKIIQQVEFYFSDANVLKDAFLLKHVRRNKLGYVSLKLITSFKKVKSLTKDYRVSAHALRQSAQLEVNEEGSKVRRLTPLPDHDETTPSRSVVAVNLPSSEAPTIESVSALFSACGEIALIRILRPGRAVPSDVKKHINKHPEIGESVCAVVEFETHESAQKACDLTNRNDWRGGMRVEMLMLKKNKKDLAKETAVDVIITENKDAGSQKSGDGASDEADDGLRDKVNKKRRKMKPKRKNSRVEEIRDCGGSPVTSGSDDSPPENNRRWSEPSRPSNEMPRKSSDPQRRNRSGSNRTSNTLAPGGHSDGYTPGSSPRTSPGVSPHGSPRNARRNIPGRSPLASELSPDSHSTGRSSPRPRSTPGQSPIGTPETHRKRGDSESGTRESGGSSPSSPWVQRRLKAQETSPLAAGTSPGASPLMGRRGTGLLANMEGVVRQPRGPDGTRGFNRGEKFVTIPCRSSEKENVDSN